MPEKEGTMKKRLISVLLAGCLAASLTIPVGATELATDQEYKARDTITVQSNGHGEYSVVTDSKVKAATAQNKEVVLAYATEDSELYKVKENKYLMEVSDDTYLMMDCTRLNPDDVSANEMTYEKYNIPEDIQQNIANTITAQKEIGNTDVEVDLFAPSLSAANTTSESYYTYGGNKMKDVSVKYWHLSADSGQKQGSNVKNLAAALKNLALSAGGVVLLPVALFSVADSAFGVYKAACGPVNYGSAADKTYSNTSYDKIVRSTYVGLGSNYLLGCVSQKVWFDTNSTYQYYQANGKHHTETTFLNTIRYTASWHNAAEVATRHVHSVQRDPAVQTTVYGTKLVF